MPNYKIFQDYADSLRVRIYGMDSGGEVESFKTTDSGSLYVTPYSGTVFAVSGDIGLNSGDIVTVVNSGDISLYVRGWSGTSGEPVFVAPGSGATFSTSGYAFNNSGDALFVRGYSGDSGNPVFVAPGSGATFSTSGYAFNNSGDALFVRGYSGDSGNPVFVAPGSGATFSTSGYVFNNSGDALFVRGYSGDSGQPVFIKAASGEMTIKIESRNTLDSGPVTSPWSGNSSGTAEGVWDVLGYNGWTLAVKYSGSSGAAVSAKLQMSVIGSGESTWKDEDGYKDFSGTSWNYYATSYHVRYARIWGQNTSATAESGALLVYLQGEY